MKHKHHIIPRHAGGTDDPANLIELTVEEHAEAHRLLYEEHGRWQDYVAWQGLSGLDANFDAAKEAMLAGSKKGRAVVDKILEQRYGSEWKKSFSTEGNNKLKELLNTDLEFRKAYIESRKAGMTAALSDTAKEKRKETFKRTGHQQGEKHNGYGTCWIYHELVGNKKCKKDILPLYIDQGWIKGRFYLHNPKPNN